MAYVKVCEQGELAPGATRIVQVNEVEIAVIRHDDAYYAYRNLCPHQGGPACEGVRMPLVLDLIDSEGSFLRQGYDESDMHIVCPWHGYEFHLSTGQNVCNKQLKLRKYTVVQQNDAIYIDV